MRGKARRPRVRDVRFVIPFHTGHTTLTSGRCVFVMVRALVASPRQRRGEVGFTMDARRSQCEVDPTTNPPRRKKKLEKFSLPAECFGIDPTI